MVLLPVLLAVAALFALVFLGRVGGAHRRLLMSRWPAVVLACAAVLALSRGAIAPGLGLAVAAAAVWCVMPYWRRHAPAGGAAEDPADEEARAALGVGRDATPDEIRAAYRAKMARAHPDRGGAHNEAARLTAARDRLLRGR